LWNEKNGPKTFSPELKIRSDPLLVGGQAGVVDVGVSEHRDVGGRVEEPRGADGPLRIVFRISGGDSMNQLRP
jgi:hypothetical protein